MKVRKKGCFCLTARPEPYLQSVKASFDCDNPHSELTLGNPLIIAQPLNWWVLSSHYM